MGVCTWVLLALSLLTVSETRCSYKKPHAKDPIYDNFDDSPSRNNYDTPPRRKYDSPRRRKYDSPRRKTDSSRSRSLGYVIAKMARFISKKFKEIDFRLDDLRQISSCSGRCTMEIPGATCQCHHNCGKEENCCSDFVFECDRSCAGICNTAFDDRFACQCDSKCEMFKNCCQNYPKVCTSSGSIDKDLKALELQSNEDILESLESQHLHPNGDADIPHDHPLPNSPSEDSLESKYLVDDGGVEDTNTPKESLESQHLHPNGDADIPHDHPLPNSPSEDSLESKYLVSNDGVEDTNTPKESLESQHLLPDNNGDIPNDILLPNSAGEESPEIQNLLPYEFMLPDSANDESLASQNLLPNSGDALNSNALPNSANDESLASQNLIPNGGGETPNAANNESPALQHLHQDDPILTSQENAPPNKEDALALSHLAPGQAADVGFEK